ncbi:MAG: RluA family pseudouridine synthase [Olsenella sp.]
MSRRGASARGARAGGEARGGEVRAGDEAGGARGWRLEKAGEGRALLRALGPTSAAELLRDATGSKRSAARVLAEGRASMAGAALRPSDALRAGDVVEVAWGAAAAGGARPAATSAAGPEAGRAATDRAAGHAAPDLVVLWEDPFALAAEKPAGLIVHSDGTGAGTLADRVRAYLAAEGSPAAGAAQPLQRLDEQTTGVVLFSKAPDFQPAFDELVAGHAMGKRYLAVVRGRLVGGPFALTGPIARDRHDARRMRVGATGKPSLTRVLPVECKGAATLVGCELGSGRRHQIRVHLADAGHPILGDALYGGGAGPLMLHALEESFAHPVTGERVRVRAPWPGRFLPAFPEREVDWDALRRL